MIDHSFSFNFLVFFSVDLFCHGKIRIRIGLKN